MVAGIHWISEHLPASAVVATSKPSLVYLVSHRLTMPINQLVRDDPAALFTPAGPITHILLTDLMDTERNAVPWALESACTHLVTLAQPDTGSMILAIRPPADTGGPDACALLKSWRLTKSRDYDELRQ